MTASTMAVPPMKSAAADLALVLMQELGRRHAERIDGKVLVDILDTLFSASLQTEEARHIAFSITFLDPEFKLVQFPPAGTHVNVSEAAKIRFPTPLNFDVATIKKLAMAVDPRTASLAVFVRNGRPVIWGIVDQFPLHRHRYMAWETAKIACVTPGLFDAVVERPGEIAVFCGHKIVARLARDRIHDRFHDALWSGPVHEVLCTYIDAFRTRVRRSVGDALYQSWGEMWKGTDEEKYLGTRDWSSPLKDFWLGSLCRLLLSIQDARHGGALLIVPTIPPGKHLAIKYKVKYDRLCETLVQYATASIQQTYLETKACLGELGTISFGGTDTLSQGYFVTTDTRELCFHPKVKGPSNEVLFRSWLYEATRDDALAALAGCVGLVASLSRVDGLVLCVGGLKVRGFGVEILQNAELDEIYLAQDASGKHVRAARSTHYGTRHRSMFRHCANHPGSIGFVISQDGDVRAVMKVANRVVVWENIQLHAEREV